MSTMTRSAAFGTPNTNTKFELAVSARKVAEELGEEERREGD